MSRKRLLLEVPIFEKCISFLNDEYWIELFRNASKGKLPKGFKFFKNKLMFKKGNKIVESVLLEEDNLEITTENIISIIKKNGNFRSTQDVENTKSRLSSVDSLSFELFSVIPNIRKYSVKLKKENSLTQSVEEIITEINKQRLFQNISENDIKMENDGTITEIKGITIHNQQIVLSFKKNISLFKDNIFSKITKTEREGLFTIDNDIE